jgi:hypothetical protein
MRLTPFGRSDEHWQICLLFSLVLNGSCAVNRSTSDNRARERTIVGLPSLRDDRLGGGIRTLPIRTMGCTGRKLAAIRQVAACGEGSHQLAAPSPALR